MNHHNLLGVKLHRLSLSRIIPTYLVIRHLFAHFCHPTKAFFSHEMLSTWFDYHAWRNISESLMQLNWYNPASDRRKLEWRGASWFSFFRSSKELGVILPILLKTAGLPERIELLTTRSFMRLSSILTPFSSSIYSLYFLHVQTLVRSGGREHTTTGTSTRLLHLLEFHHRLKISQIIHQGNSA